MKHEEYKEHLSTQIISMADVRSQKASKSPEDKRHKRAEESLGALARNLERVSSSDPFIARAGKLRFGDEKMHDMNEDELARMSQTEMDFIAQYGFMSKGVGNPEQFLRGLVDILTRAAVMAR